MLLKKHKSLKLTGYAPIRYSPHTGPVHTSVTNIFQEQHTTARTTVKPIWNKQIGSKELDADRKYALAVTCCRGY